MSVGSAFLSTLPVFEAQQRPKSSSASRLTEREVSMEGKGNPKQQIGGGKHSTNTLWHHSVVRERQKRRQFLKDECDSFSSHEDRSAYGRRAVWIQRVGLICFPFSFHQFSSLLGAILHVQ
jgi:hypothetical protein